MGFEALKRYYEIQKQIAQKEVNTLLDEDIDKLLNKSIINNDSMTQINNDCTNEFLEEYIQRRLIKTFKRVQENLKNSEELRIKINKDIEGAAPLEILVDCIKCISLMTDDKKFFDINVKKLKGQQDINIKK